MDEHYVDGNDSPEVSLFQFPGTGEDLATIGLRYSDQGRYHEALRLFEQAVRTSPENAGYRVMLASACQHLAGSDSSLDQDRLDDLLDRACEQLFEALKIDPDCADAYRELGYLYRTMEAPWRAREMWSYYLELEPMGPAAEEVRSLLEQIDRLQNLHRLCEEASYHVNHGEPERGLQLASEALEEDPEWYDAWFWKGLACRELEMLDDGIRAFARACELDATNPYAFHELAALLARKGEIEAAEGFWRKALELDDDEPWITANLALLLWRLDRREEAEQLMIRSLDVDPANRRLWKQLRSLRAGEPAPPPDLP